MMVRRVLEVVDHQTRQILFTLDVTGEHEMSVERKKRDMAKQLDPALHWVRDAQRRVKS